MKDITEFNSDKFYWHRYIDTYEIAFKKLGDVESIIEYGVAYGESIKWLSKRFPGAKIVGVDIAPTRPEWPQSDSIRYLQMDQGDRAGIRKALEDLNISFDLVIEDGSHIPQHQAICLTETLPHVRSGGLYILEDIHSSHREHQLFKEFQAGDLARQPNALNVLLGLLHIKETGKILNDDILSRLTSNHFFTADHIKALFQNLSSIDLYRRTTLPLHCWNCGGDRYDYAALKCDCSADLFANADSMSFLLRKK